MDAGKSETYTSMTLTVPQSAQNGTRYVRALVDAKDAVKESSETNNDSFNAIAVTSIPSDVKITSVSAPFTGTTAKAGASFTVQCQVLNNSTNAFSDDFYIYYYYCPTKAKTSCTKFGSTFVPDNFAANQKKTITSVSMTLPSSVVYGAGYIWLFVDATDKVKESDETNNDAFDAITVSTYPDLTVSASTVPFTGNTTTVGSTFTGQYTILNSAKTSRLTGSVAVRYFYCPGAATTGCIKLGDQTVTFPKAVDAGGSHKFTSPTLTMPSGIQNGKRYILAHVNFDGKVNESVVSNNTDYDEIAVTAIQSDVKITSVSAPYTGSTAKAGDSFTVQCQVLNNSSNAFSDDFYIYYYYCPTKAKTNCTKFGSTFVPDNFAANQKVTYTSANMTLPSSAVYGMGYIWLFVDATNTITESDETNNDAFDAITVSTYPDLTVSASTVPFTGNTTTVGSTFTGQYTILNSAKTSRLTGSFAVRYFYCPGATTTGCIKIADQTVTPLKGIDAGGTYQYTSTTLTMPPGIKNGKRYIMAHVNFDGKVNESVITNNTDYDDITVSAVPSDLKIVSTKEGSGSTAYAGAEFTFQCGVKNDSKNSVSNSFQIYYYYCTAQSKTTCTKLGSTAVSDPFSAGQTRTYSSAKLTLPAAVLPGTGYIRVFVDAANAVPESNETNNDAYYSIKVTALPDLSFTSSTVPISGKTSFPGDTFKGSYTITNKAKTSAITKAFDVIYYYCPAMKTTGCIPLGTENITKKLAAGASYQYTSMSLTMPPTAKSKIRYIRAFVDAKNTIKEVVETNNNDYDEIAVVGYPDMVVKTFTAKVSGTSVTFKAKVCNEGDVITTSFKIGLFLNRKLEPQCTDKPDGDWIIKTTDLDKDKCVEKSNTVTSVKAGNNTAWILADANCTIYESDEKNNVKSATYAIKGPDASIFDADMGASDLIVTEASITEAGGEAGGEAGADAAEAGTDTIDDGIADKQPAKKDATWLKPSRPEEEGCSCDVGSSAPSGAGVLLLALLALALFRRRRR